MKPTLFLRIASVLTLVHAAAHTAGGVFGKPVNAVASSVVAQMQSNVFPMMGASRTYWDFYFGMGLGVSIFLTFEAIAFWLLAGFAKTRAAELRPLFAVFMLAYLALAVNSFLYFFILPVIVEILIAACFAMAIVSARSIRSVPA